MGGSKTEVNLKRLLAAAPKQQNQQKLIHYVATLREQLEQLAEETTPEGVPRISKAKISDYSKEIEALASKLQAPLSHSDLQPSEELVVGMANENSPTRGEEDQLPGGKKNEISSTQGLRRRFVIHDTAEGEETPIKLDAAAQAQIEKHRQLQENLTDEMVVLARQLKESSLTMNQSLQNTEKILDSTEKAVEHSLASTRRANSRAVDIYSKSFSTTCFTWLAIFAMTCIFIMVALLIRVT